MPLERRVEHGGRLLESPALERVDHRVEHQADPGQRLHRTVVEEERQAPALLLLGGDQLVREPCALGLAHLRLGEQARVLDARGRRSRRAGSPARAPRGRAASRAPAAASRSPRPRMRSGSSTAARRPCSHRDRAAHGLGARRALSPRAASARARRSGSCVAAIAPIDSISDSRKLDCAVSSSSATSCRRRSVTIR